MSSYDDDVPKPSHDVDHVELFSSLSRESSRLIDVS